MIQAVLAQVHPGEDHFPVAQAGQLMKGREHGFGVQAAAGAPYLRHDAVAALVAAALLDLEPGPGVAGGLVDFPGPEGRRRRRKLPPRAPARLSDVQRPLFGNYFLPLPWWRGLGGGGLSYFHPHPSPPPSRARENRGGPEAKGDRLTRGGQGGQPGHQPQLPVALDQEVGQAPFSWLPNTACTPAGPPPPPGLAGHNSR